MMYSTFAYEHTRFEKRRLRTLEQRVGLVLVNRYEYLAQLLPLEPLQRRI